MAKIIGIGNGYGRLEGYTSKYASLTFPLTRHHLNKLYRAGYLDKDEYTQTLLDIGHNPEYAKWATAVASITVKQWKKALKHARTI